MVVRFSSGGGPRAEPGSPPDPVTPGGARGSRSDQSLRPSERLRYRSEFQRVYREGKSFPGSLLVLFVLTSPDLDRKAGFVAGRRVGNAVSRNRAKRLLREAFRLHKHCLPRREVNLVLVARKGCGEAEYSLVEQCYLDLLRAAGFRPGATDDDQEIET